MRKERGSWGNVNIDPTCIRLSTESSPGYNASNVNPMCRSHLPKLTPLNGASIHLRTPPTFLPTHNLKQSPQDGEDMNAVVRLHSIKTPPPLLPSTPHSFVRSFVRSFPSFCSCPHSRVSGVGVSRPNPGFAYRKNKRREAEALYLEEKKEEKMTVTPAVRISERKLVVNGRTVLTGVPDNVVSTSPLTMGPVEGVFLGAAFDESKSRHVVSLGTLRDVRFLSCFRFKLWWMAQKMGTSGRDVPLETQFLLVETEELGSDDLDFGNGNGNGNVVGDGNSSSPFYTVFLPLVEGQFRACLQGNSDDEVELCIESGDKDTEQSFFSHSLFVSTGSDPFAAITDAIAAVKSHLKTFRQRSEKKLPGIVDYFGWCTWDAFYQDVTQEGVEAGLASLADGGAPPKFVIIDDGWQSVGSDEERKEGDGGQKPLLRLTGIKENEKFQKEEGPSSAGIENIVKVAKEKHGLKYVYVWHAITGYWGGVRPGVAAMEHYASKMQYPMVSPGVTENEPGWKTDALTLQGLGLVNPKQVYRFYNELHSYLAAAGVDGVKVDVQCILETLGAGLGGRVQLTRQYHQALDASVGKNFSDNGIIACMSHNTDALYCSKQTAVVRASDDFYPRDPVSHTIHIASVAYNSVFLGEFMQPDWDMFHSQHPAGEYHASARAISGGPVYVSDAPGNHNFQILRKLVLPDGSILRPRLPGRPTRDCLFTDPARDGKSLLKIWNMNRFTGVLGVYNCQGAAWNNVEKKNTFHKTKTDALTGVVRAGDVHHLREAVVGDKWEGDCVAYRHGDGELIRLPAGAALPVSLKVLQHEIFTVSPVKVLAPGVEFAPVGLIDMYNAGGAIVGLSYRAVNGVDSSYFDSCSANEVAMRPLENRGAHAVATVTMEVKGCGRFGVYSSIKPRKCLVGSEVVEFEYDSSSGLATVALESMPESVKQAHVMLLEF